MSGWVAGWRLALRLAAREAWRAKARSAVVVLMILIPVFGVATADILIRTSQLSDQESMPRQLGSATARIAIVPGKVTQRMVDPFMSDGRIQWGGPGKAQPLSAIWPIIGARPYTTVAGGYTDVVVPAGVDFAHVDIVDPRNPLTDGMYHLRAGRWPASDGEVVINPYLADRGLHLGETITLGTEEGDATPTSRTVVGIAASASVTRSDLIVALPGSMPSAMGGVVADGTSYLVGGGPISWQQVQVLNKLGGVVLSRSVVAHPPDLSAYTSSGPVDMTAAAVVGLLVVMALLEVVLLAGPALAVSAKRQSRSLALIASAGGTPSQTRRVVLAMGLVLGTVGAAAGAVLALPAARLGEPFMQRLSTDTLGPYDARWYELLGIALIGVGSAVAAATVPAWIASRQSVVAVLAGRRGSRRPSLRSPVMGVVLLIVGVIGAVSSTRTENELGILALCSGALFTMLGMILLVGAIVAGVAKAGSRLPLPLRFAVRDADRHRSRMVPAVAAVAATVMGITAVGIGFASYFAQQRSYYMPEFQIGTARIMVGGADESAVTAVVKEHLPHATITTVSAVDPVGAGRVEARATAVGCGSGPLPETSHQQVAPRSNVLVTDGTVILPEGVSSAQTSRAQQLLAGEGAVVYSSIACAAGTVDLTIAMTKGGALAHATVPAVVIQPSEGGSQPEGRVVLSPALAQRLGLHATTRLLALSGANLTGSAAADTESALRAMKGPYMSVERGFQASTFTRLLELILFLLGAFLVVGGTLTATYLSLSDAGDDLATLAAVGAGRRTRRLVAGAYAVAVSLIGAVLGALAGLVPGIGIVYWINGGERSAGPITIDYYVTIPWGLMAVTVIGLPVAMALLVALTTRGRLPMVARLQ